MPTLHFADGATCQISRQAAKNLLYFITRDMSGLRILPGAIRHREACAMTARNRRTINHAAVSLTQGMGSELAQGTQIWIVFNRATPLAGRLPLTFDQRLEALQVALHLAIQETKG